MGVAAAAATQNVARALERSLARARAPEREAVAACERRRSYVRSALRERVRVRTKGIADDDDTKLRLYRHVVKVRRTRGNGGSSIKRKSHLRREGKNGAREWREREKDDCRECSLEAGEQMSSADIKCERNRRENRRQRRQIAPIYRVQAGKK